MNKMLLFLLLAVLPLSCTIFSPDSKDDGKYPTEPIVLYSSSTDSLFRIPALATGKGSIVALTDHRHQHGSDVGAGKPIDVLRRVSSDNGMTWSPAEVAISCEDATYAEGIYGFGDAAIGSDSKSGDMIILCVGDREAKSYQRRGRLEVHRFVSHDGGKTWGDHSNLTDAIYGLHESWKCLFIGSGKIFQSRVVKQGSHYRLYCAALVNGYGNAVLYSDDFGVNWNLLGGPDSCCPKGDEPKVEELPDGSVILSSRTYGRYFNIFRYDDNTYKSGQWTGVSKSESIIAQSNSTNGEIMAIQAKEVETGQKCWVYLQSVPAGPGRSHVSIYYKAIPVQKDYSDIDAASFGTGWEAYQITDKDSAYSTLCALAHGRIGLLYEQSGADVNGYDIVFESLDIQTITENKYK